MKGKFLMSTALLTALLSTSCSSDLAVEQDLVETGNVLTFSLRTPAGEKVSYTRALHDNAEYAINSLQLYEYEVTEGEGGEKSTSLCRVMKYPTGVGRDVIDLHDNGDGTYNFSIVIPADNMGKTYTYRIVANNATENVKIGESADYFRDSWYSAVILKDLVPEPAEPAEGEQAETDPEEVTPESPKGDALAAPEVGIAMTGTATATTSGSEEITIGSTTQCEVKLTRIVSRVDICYETPNLNLTKVELQGAPVKTFLFPRTDSESGLPLYAEVDRLKLDINPAHTLPTGYLKDNDAANRMELKKAFYLYERSNSEEDSAVVHIEYTVAANGTEYQGSLDIPFRRTSGDMKYIDTERNHLYTIVLGNNDDPVSGKVSAKLIVDDWTLVEIDEPLTD